MTPLERNMIPIPEGKELLDFQAESIIEIERTDSNILLADEMGLGKTIQMCGLINKTKPGRVLIVCPNSLIINWWRELKEWTVDREISDDWTDVFCVTQMYIPGFSDIVIASYEGVRKWAPLLRNEEWDLMIVDEAHYCKTPSAQRTVAVFSIPSKKKIYMTGTPILNYPYEIFPLLHSLSPDIWSDFPSFESRYCFGDGNKYGRNLEELRKKLIGEWRADGSYRAPQHPAEGRYIDVVPKIMIRRLKKDVLKDLPRKRRQVIEIPADGKLAEIVKMEKILFASMEGKGIYEIILGELNALKDGGEDEETFQAIIEALTSSRRYFFEEISRIRHQLALAKVPEVVAHAENVLAAKEKIVVFAHHIDVIKKIQGELELLGHKCVRVTGENSNVEKRDDAVRAFQNDDSIRVFLGTIGAAGVGITLTAASHMIFAELDWTPSRISQCEDRCHRIGQEYSLLVQHIVVEGSMDSFMAKKIVKKQKTISKAIGA